MINPISTGSELVDDGNDDDGFSLTWLPTEDECRRIKEYKEYVQQSPAYHQSILLYALAEEPSVVLDGFLFLGNLRHGSNLDLLERFKIEHIINVSETDVSDKFPLNRFDVVHMPMEDRVETDVKQHFDRTNELLHSYYMKDERCLVHCAAGVSRSATIVLAYLMKYHHNTLKDAFHYLIDKRPQIDPNEGFLLQLLRYENELIKSREIVTTSDTSAASTSTVLSSSDNTNNPIETVQQFEKKNDMQTITKAKLVKTRLKK